MTDEDENVVIALEEIVPCEDVQKPKKKRTEKQVAAFKRCQEKRAENSRIRAELKELREKERLIIVRTDTTIKEAKSIDGGNSFARRPYIIHQG